MYSIFKCQITKNIKLQYNVKLLCAKLHYALRWDMGDEKISSYAHKSSLDKYFSKISHEQNKSWIFLKQAKITTVAPFRSENSDFQMKLKIVGDFKLGPSTESEFSLLKGATVVFFACFRKIQLLFCLWDIFEKYLWSDDLWA